MNLAMHAATPKLEAFYNYYDGTQGELGAESKYTKGKVCGSWVDWYGEVVCDVETLAHLAGVEAIDSPEVSSTDAYVRLRFCNQFIDIPSPPVLKLGQNFSHLTTYFHLRLLFSNALPERPFSTRR